MQDNSQKKKTYPMLLKAANRTVALVTAWLVPVFAFFVIAQFRRFLDANMLFLIRILSFTSIALLVFVFFELVQIGVFTIWYKNIQCLTALGMVIPAALLAAGILAATLSIEYVSGGI
jgi:hypothetical protein